MANLLAQFCRLLLAQSQTPGTGGNSAVDALDKYVSNLNQNTPKYNSDPYSQLLKLE
jgi:hypothetical protein